ncbi:hypothetical protein BH09BAC1_BH09BAC1_04010 [soil metagenome]
MHSNNRTFDNQRKFAATCRGIATEPLVGANPARITTYQELVIGVVEDTMENAYPLTVDLLTETERSTLLTDFWKGYKSPEPQVWKLPFHLHQYVVESNYPLIKLYPHLIDLLWFEWREIEVYMMEDIPVTYHTNGNLLTDPLVLNPELIIENLAYPVHKQNARTISSAEKGNYYVVLHRHPESGKVVFTDVAPAFALMLDLLQQQPLTFDDLLDRTISALGINAGRSTITPKAQLFIQSAINTKMILGFTI